MGMKNDTVPIITSFGNQLFLPNCYGYDSNIKLTALLKCSNSDDNTPCTSSTSGLITVEDNIVNDNDANLLIQVETYGIYDPNNKEQLGYQRIVSNGIEI